MNCERAEGYLSAFLDNALDPRLCQQVRAHVEDCVHCRAILDDYRSFDHLLATTARIEPPETLRARIFESEEYRRILEAHEAGADVVAQDAEDETFDGSDLPDLPEDLPLDPIDPDELDLPELADLPEMGPQLGDAAEAPPGASRFARVGSSMWSKALLPVAAVLTLTLGAALLMRQGLLPFGAQSTPGMKTTLGNPGQQGIPLAAGPRVVYLHDGILWSAPENGPGIAQPLTPSGASGVTVGSWSVSPTSRLVAYIDTRSGKLHVVRSDGLNDRIVGSSVSGGIAWSSDSGRVAYLASASGSHVLHVVNADGSNDITISSNGADAANAVWSGDSAWLAYTETHDGTMSVHSYDLTNNAAHALAPQADAADAQASVSQLAWLSDIHHPIVTWATTGANGTIAGVYSQSAFDGSAQQLTPSGAHYSAAAYSAARGAWLLGDGNSLTLLSLADGRRTTVAVLDGPASSIVWSSAGVAAVTHGSAISLWSPSTGLVAVNANLGGVAPSVASVWSADGQYLLYATTGGVQLAHLSSGRVATATVTTVLQATDVSALGFAPDGHGIAVVTSQGIVLIAPDGTHAKLVDHHTPDGGVLVWSVAG